MRSRETHVRNCESQAVRFLRGTRLSNVKKADFSLILMVDTKVLSTPTMARNGAIVSIDFLETSIILIAPFTAVFSGNNFDFQKCQNAPFLISFVVQDQVQIIRKHLWQPQPLKALYCQIKSRPLQLM
jgi:hypothetical protein